MKLSINQILEKGIAAHNAGNLQEAKQAFESILQSQPKHPEANHHLGLVAISLNQIEAALQLFKIALDVNPNIELFWISYVAALVQNNQAKKAKRAIKKAKEKGFDDKKLRALVSQSEGVIENKVPSRDLLNSLIDHYQNGRLSEAEKLALSITTEFPRHQFAWKILGAVLRTTGRNSDAVYAKQTLVALSPQDAAAHSNLGITLKELGRLEEALASYKQAITLKPDFAEAHNNLGNTLLELGRSNEAVASFKQAIALKPNFSEAHHNLSHTLRELGRLDEAEASCRQAIRLKPDNAEARSNLGITLKGLGRLKEALASFVQATVLKPNFPEAHNNLGNTLRELGRLDEAEVSCRQAVALKSDYVEAHNNLGITLKELGKIDEAEASLTEAIALNPDFAEAHNNLGNILQEQGRLEEALASYKQAIALDSDVLGVRSNLLFLSASVRFDASDYLKEAQGFSDIVAKGIDSRYSTWSHSKNPTKLRVGFVSGDLKGHPVGYFLEGLLFQLQSSSFASTGLPEMDYILGDPFVTPQSEAHHFTEEIWQLPESYLCFTPPDRHLEVSPLPALNNKFLTFGCFNNLSRMTDEVLSVRADILHAVPNSKLFLKDKRLGYKSGRDRILSRFASYGIPKHRLILEGKSSREKYLESYHRIDIALSPFPYGGGTTSVEGLWMGVPVIARKGNYFLSHLGESIAHNSNLSDWIAEDNEDYIAKAIEFSSDTNALKLLRQSLRENLLKAPLYDLQRFANNFERALWQMRGSINH